MHDQPQHQYTRRIVIGQISSNKRDSTESEKNPEMEAEKSERDVRRIKKTTTLFFINLLKTVGTNDLI